MADCHKFFKEFNKDIKLFRSKRKDLKKAREAIREKIRKYFTEELEISGPLFWQQGSFAMGTIINPLDGEYDLDDGVYLQDLDANDMGKWPTPSAVHSWVYKSIEGHTDQLPIDKATCIRVVYAGQYHIDLPIYGIYNEKYYLAKKGDDGWTASSPKDLTVWFKNQVSQKGEQLREIVRCFKAWADYKSSTCKLPSGLILTVVAEKNYVNNVRNDVAFGATIQKIYAEILSNDVIVYNPVDPQEILTKRLTDTQKKNFKDLLNDLLRTASAALKKDSKKESCKLWQKVFGERFPECKDSEEGETPLRTYAPPLLRDDARSA